VSTFSNPNGTDTRVPQNVFFCFSNAVWASANGGFRIVSDILVLELTGIANVIQTENCQWLWKIWISLNFETSITNWFIRGSALGPIGGLSARREEKREEKKLRDCWTDVDETCHVHSMDLRTQLLGSEMLNVAPLPLRGAGEMIHPDRGVSSVWRAVDLSPVFQMMIGSSQRQLWCMPVYRRSTLRRCVLLWLNSAVNGDNLLKTFPPEIRENSPAGRNPRGSVSHDPTSWVG